MSWWLWLCVTFGVFGAYKLVSSLLRARRRARNQRLCEEAGFSVIVVGGGVSGIAMAISLEQAGIPYVVLEKCSQLGGTWHLNTYPGCACDVPSHLYSFSFELNPEWPSVYASQPHILKYLVHCATKYGVLPKIKFGQTVEKMSWDDKRKKWSVLTTDGVRHEANVVVNGMGGLHYPQFPNIPGRKQFAGPSWHSSQWDHNVDLTNKTVAVVGSAASAVQLVPRIVDKVSKLLVFQRTPNWITPRFNRVYPKWLKRIFAAFPCTMRLLRWLLYWRNEFVLLAVFNPRSPLAPLVRKQMRKFMRTSLGDKSLEDKVIPRYKMGCKRVLVSSDFLPALAKPHVQLVTDPIVRIADRSLFTVPRKTDLQAAAAESRSAPTEDRGVADKGADDSKAQEVPPDASEHRVDAIIWATGFKLISLDKVACEGRAGTQLCEVMRDTQEAYLGMCTPQFPNMFGLVGPNTGLGHNSIIFMIECQCAYIRCMLEMMLDQNVTSVEVKRSVIRRYYDDLWAKMKNTVWVVGGCSSYYQHTSGKVFALWPQGTPSYWWHTLFPDLDQFNITAAVPPKQHDS